jgi:CHAT domain-containing protein/tetratricopeptide (TPR) repeat protein
MRRPLVFSFLVYLLMALSAAGAEATVSASEEPPPPKPSTAVQQLLNEVARLVSDKKLTQALATADQALAVARERQDAPGEALTEQQRSLCLNGLGRTNEAVAALRAAAAAWRKAGDGPGQVGALVVAALPLLGEKPDERRRLLEQAVALAEAEPQRPLAAASMLHAMGLQFYDLGHPLDAQLLWQAAVAIRERFPASLDLASSLNNLGMIAHDLGKLGAAWDFYQRALAIERGLAPDSLEMAASLNNLGGVALDRGGLVAAWNFYQQALTIREKRGDSLAIANSLNNLAVVTQRQGNLVAARDYHERALAIQEKDPAAGSHDLAASLNNLGTISLDQGDLSAARHYYGRSLAIEQKLNENSLAVANTLSNLAAVALHAEDLNAARNFLQRALIIQQPLVPDSLDVARTLGHLGMIALRRRDLEVAWSLHEQTLRIKDKLSPGSLAVAISLNNLGVVAAEQRNLGAAREFHQKALAIGEKLAPDSLEMATSLTNLGAVYWDQNDLAAAEELARRAWRIVRLQALAVTGDEARQAFGASTVDYAANLMRCQVARQELPEAFVTLEEGRAQALQQLLFERRADLWSIAPKVRSAYQAALMAQGRAEQAISEAGLREALARRQLQEAAKTAPPLAHRKRLQEQLDAALKQLEKAQAAYTQARLGVDQAWGAVKKSAPRVFPQPLSPEQALRVVPRGALFVAFAVGEEQTHLFLLPSGAGDTTSLRVSTIPVGHQELKELVSDFAVAVAGIKDGAASPGLGTASRSRALFARLFPPAARQPVLTAKRLLLSPDGPLWNLPFAALVTNDTGPPRYLGLEKPLTYTPSLTLFAQFRNGQGLMPKNRKPVILAVGKPVFHRQPAIVATAEPRPRKTRGERSVLLPDGSPPDPLPQTGREAAAIARLYGGKPLIGEVATEASIRRHVGQADVVHLATHGYLHPHRGMSSGVLLTVPKREPKTLDSINDGALLAWEIRDQLKLRAELVVLSACETGKGNNVRGEGIVGLTRALQYAGARSIVASQWKVNDASTTTLMVAFHQKLRAGLPKDEALRQAMQLVKSNPETALPYYWAPFFLIGNPDNPSLGMGRETK